MAVNDSTRHMVRLTRELREMATKERPDDEFLRGMLDEMMKTAERLLAREIGADTFVRERKID